MTNKERLGEALMGVLMKHTNLSQDGLDDRVGRMLEIIESPATSAVDLLHAAKRLEARGFFAPSSCADAETSADMAAMRTAIDRSMVANSTCMPTITIDEMAAFNRFCDTCEDGEGYDVPKPMMQRLARIGLVRHVSRGIYQTTDFGCAVREVNAQPPTMEGPGGNRLDREIPGNPDAVASPMNVAIDSYQTTSNINHKGETVKSSNQEILPVIGTAMAGGFYAGRIRIDGQAYALIVAPKAEGEFEEEWNGSTKAVEAATSYFDGRANTLAMAAAGSELAKSALHLQIGGHNDWYIPSRDELEICYRNLKPTTDTNYCYRGDNPSSIPPGYIYTETSPAQTEADAFKEGGAEAFDDAWYWTSTQDAASHAYAWMQGFAYGYQGYVLKSYEYRARAVRRLLVIE